MTTMTIATIWGDINSSLAQTGLPLPYFIASILLTAVLYLQWSVRGAKPNATLVTTSSAKAGIAPVSSEIASRWFSSLPERSIRVIADVGEVTVLPPAMAEEIRSDKRVTFSGWVYKAFHAHLPGFEGFREGSQNMPLLQSVILKYLTQSLDTVILPLADETSLAVTDLLPSDKEMHAIPLHSVMAKLISRTSSRVFLGQELCRDESWLAAIQQYTAVANAAAMDLRLWPASVRFIVHWFLPSCKRTRALVRTVQRLVEAVIQKRQRARGSKRNSEAGEETQFDDVVEWLDKAANGSPYNPVSAQLVLSVVAIHTTSDLLCQTLIDLAQHPETVQALRQEMAEVLRDDGWQKTSLHKLKLMDSVIKESQRLKPTSIVSMKRQANKDMKLSDGTVIPKNGLLGVSSHRMWDATVYNDPHTWNGHRFYDMRKLPSKETSAQLVTTSPEHMGFGYGRHACPGRFFAANEIKIALVYLLLRYDWSLPKDVNPGIKYFGFALATDGSLKMEVRRRDEELKL